MPMPSASIATATLERPEFRSSVNVSRSGERRDNEYWWLAISYIQYSWGISSLWHGCFIMVFCLRSLNGTSIMTYMPFGDFPYNPLPAQGWQCPVCKSVMAPSTPSCMRCPTQVTTGINTSQCPSWRTGESITVDISETLSLCEHGVPRKFNACSQCSGITSWSLSMNSEINA